MPIEPRQLQLLKALVKREQELRAESRPEHFMLLQMPGPSYGLKPGVEGEDEILPSEADILDLQEEDLVRLAAATSESVVARFMLTPAGRAAGAERSVRADLQTPMTSAPPPGTDSVLSWLHGLGSTADGAAILESGSALINEALATYGQGHLEAVARSILDLREEGLVRFDDLGADLDQIPDSQRVAVAQGIRLTSRGRDRLRDRVQPSPAVIQIVHAAEAQVIAGNVNNYNSFDELLDGMEQALAGLVGIDDQAREEADGMLGKLRSATGKVATGAATSAGGALFGAVLKQTLGLP